MGHAPDGANRPGLEPLPVLPRLLALALREKAGLYLAMALAAILGLLIPGTLIQLCGMATMRCRMVMKPAMTILCALMLITSILGFLMARGKDRA